MPSISLSEKLSRFIFKDDYIRRQDNKVHWRAFDPPKHNLILSIQRISDVIEEEIWSIGERIATERRQTLKGRADIMVSSVRNNRLDIVPDAPPSKHANIINWPPQKEERMGIAMKLAASAQGHRRA